MSQVQVESYAKGGKVNKNLIKTFIDILKNNFKYTDEKVTGWWGGNSIDELDVNITQKGIEHLYHKYGKIIAIQLSNKNDYATNVIYVTEENNEIKFLMLEDENKYENKTDYNNYFKEVVDKSIKETNKEMKK